MTKNKGFSIIELMIVVVIIAILAAVAYPYYRHHILSSNRLEAKSSLMELSQLQENFLVKNNLYATNLIDLNAKQAGFAENGGNFISKNSKLDLANGYYQLTLIGDGATYTLTARANGSQEEDTDCITFTIDDASRKTATDNMEQVN
ncbi:MAG: prepilin-type N-terminal cleavage/methylation domain-containing protein, partial [Proteobacteria bacterium]|nr:prepilin-type N-terminal cleavage/methylation domain-containing protein [Pseudomonadota bacterium]